MNSANYKKAIVKLSQHLLQQNEKDKEVEK